MPSDELWWRSTAAMDEAIGGRAWVDAILEAERGLAAAEEAAGVIPDGASALVDAATADAQVNFASLRGQAWVAGTLVVPLLAAVRSSGPDGGRWLHVGATSQDVVDTALALVARRAAAVMIDGMRPIGAVLAALAEQHRATPMLGRTLLRSAAPITFGLKAAGWLAALVDATGGVEVAASRIPAQLGGPVGTLSALGDAGPAVLRGFAERLRLPEPTLPWHTRRAPVTELAAALGILAGTVAKVAGDIVLLAQDEVGEVAEADRPGRGVSSAMPSKRNPSSSVNAIAAARRAAPLAAALVSALDHEHERAAGAWQAEAPMLCDLFGHVALAVRALSEALDGLEIDVEAMESHLHLAADGGEGTGCSQVFVDRALAAYRASALASAGDPS